MNKGDKVLVELTYAEEQEYNGSMFYNENTNRLIAIENPRVAKPPRVIVEVSGGVVQNVYVDQEIEVTLVDWDNINEGDTCELNSFQTSRILTEEILELFPELDNEVK